jgi:hypothetical protein
MEVLCHGAGGVDLKMGPSGKSIYVIMSCSFSDYIPNRVDIPVQELNLYFNGNARYKIKLT